MFHVSVRGDIKISGGVFEWKNKKSMEVQLAVEYVFGSLGVYWIKKKNEMKWACGNMAAMRSLCSGWLQNHVFFSVWMEKQKTEKLMEVQLPMEYVFGSLGVYWIKKKIKWGVCVVDDYETMFFKCLDGKTKTGKINGGVADYGVCVW